MIAAVFVVVYVALALLARYYLVRPFAITPWNPAAGFAMGLLLVYGVRLWPALAIAATVSFLLARGVPPPPYLQFLVPATITVGYLGMAALLRGGLGFRIQFDRARDVGLLVAVSAAGTLLMGLVIVSVFRVGNSLPQLEFGHAVLRFWIGHLLGIVINTPVLLLLLSERSRVGQTLMRRSRLELIAQLAAVIATLFLIFGLQWNDEYKWFYLTFLPLIWIATRHGIVGAAIGVALIQLGLIIAILNSDYQVGTAVTEFQFMMLALAVTGLFLGMFVTEREEVHDALDRSESRLRAMVSNAVYGMITVDERDVIVAANPAAAAIFGVRDGNLDGMRVCEIIPEFSLKACAGDALEVDGVLRDGSIIPIELSIGATTGQTPMLRIAIFRDVTARRELQKRFSDTQAELNRSARLAAAGEMAAALAHELHQPLSAIRNYASASRLVSSVDGTHMASELLLKVESESVRAAEIVQRLRDYFQTGTSRLERVDVGEFVATCLDRVREEAERQGVDLKLVAANKVDLLIDRVQIETVLHCLIGNAIDAVLSKEAGERRVRVETTNGGAGWINVSVIDTGPGIGPVMLGRLFEPFATSKLSGTGLGLSVSRSLVEAHGGRLWAESPPAGGAIFHFSLPIAEPAPGVSHVE